MSKNKKPDWQPTSSFATLRQRAELLRAIREFFYARNVLEVQTPILSQHTVTDVYIDSFSSDYQTGDHLQTYYLQTSPEYAMKRLLAADSGPIYQISKAFRNGECGRLHNPEFTMLEWYRPGFDHHQLMDEIDLFLQTVLKLCAATRMSYRELFAHYTDIDPFTCEVATLHAALLRFGIELQTNSNELDHNSCLELLLTHVIEPQLGQQQPLFIYDFPCDQAALARIRDDNPRVAERFELYIQGTEVANGFHELTDAQEQRQRFQQDQTQRTVMQRAIPKIDERLLAALDAGLPQCAGVAIGLDRLTMLHTGAHHIHEVIPFPWAIA